MRMRLRLVGSAAASTGIGIALAPTPALARILATRIPEAGPVPAGGRAIWAERGRGAGELRLSWTKIARHGPIRVMPVPRAKPGRGESIDETQVDGIVASPSYVAVLRAASVCPRGNVVSCSARRDLLAGRIGGRLRVIATDHGSQSGVLQPNNVALTGDKLVYMQEGGRCEAGATQCGRVVVRRLGRPRLAPRTLASSPSHGFSVRAAGMSVAWTVTDEPSTPAIVVADLDTGRPRYTATAAELGARGFLSWDLQGDGTVAVVLQTGADLSGPGPLAYFSPRLTRPRRLPFAAEVDELHVASNRIVFLAPARGQAENLTSTQLDGRRSRLASFADRLIRVGNVGVAGSVVTWSAQRVDRQRTDCPSPGRGAPCVSEPIGPTHIFAGSIR